MQSASETKEAPPAAVPVQRAENKITSSDAKRRDSKEPSPSSSSPSVKASTGQDPAPSPAKSAIHEVLPKSGLVYSERGALSDCFILCKPKILPLRSAVLEQLAKIEQAVAEEEEQQNKAESGGLYRDR